MNDINSIKNTLRSEYRKIRNNISITDRELFSHNIFLKLIEDETFIKADNLLLYSSYNSEVITTELLEYALTAHKNVYYPKVKNLDMDFYIIDSPDSLIPGYQGIKEPIEDESNLLKSVSDSVIIVPGLVFGKNMYRIGYGKAFYDRFFARFPDIYKIGLCYQCQIRDFIINDEYDFCMDLIYTEKNKYIQ